MRNYLSSKTPRRRPWTCRRRFKVAAWRLRRIIRNSTWVGLVAIVLGVHVGSAYLIYAALPDWDDRASFGDMFGAVNALFAALAFAGVIYAILLQRKELSLQRRELQLTRYQIAEQTRIHEQRLGMAVAAQRPLLRFVRLASRTGEGPTSGDWPNSGVLTFELHNDGGPMYHATFTASLMIRYVDWINTPRVAEYQLLVRQEQGVMFLIQDVDPITAIKRGLLNEVPGYSFRLPDGKEAPELEDLFPDYFQGL